MKNSLNAYTGINCIAWIMHAHGQACSYAQCGSSSGNVLTLWILKIELGMSSGAAYLCSYAG